MNKLLLLVMAVVMVGCASPTFTADPSNPQYDIVEAAIRKQLKKPTGALTKSDLEKVTRLDLSGTGITDAGLKEVAKLKNSIGFC